MTTKQSLRRDCFAPLAMTVLIFSFVLQPCVLFAKGKKEKIEDTDHNGKPDAWSKYDSCGQLKTKAKDTNGDGKPNQFIEFIKGRNLILKESDRNFDGKIDKRSLQEWGERRLVPGQPPIPGYVSLWTEEDNNFDGIVDVYKERHTSTPKESRAGKPIDTRSSHNS